MCCNCGADNTPRRLRVILALYRLARRPPIVLESPLMRSVFSSLLPLALLSATPAYGSALELGEVQVRSEESSELKRSERAHEIPGASNLIDMTRIENGRAASNADILAYQPGVYAQTAGNDGAKAVSVRGSGINRAPSAHGPACM